VGLLTKLRGCGPLKDDKSLKQFTEDDASSKEILEIAKARREAATAKVKVKVLTSDLEEITRRYDLLASVKGSSLKPPKWLSPKRKRNDTGIVCAVLSDTHFDEVVNPAEMDFRNAYNRDIATMRLERFFTKIVLLSKEYITGLDYDGCVLFMGGDMFSGDIHEELSETNEDTMLGSVLYWAEQLAAGINLLADEFGKVHVPVVVGNHSRRTRKPRMKHRARDNFDWFLGKQLEHHFADDERVTFQVPDTADAFVKVHDSTYLLTHGDQAKGGGGIGGIWPPIMRLVARKKNNTEFDCMVLGHWHQLVWGGNFIINGSLKGYDEYAALANFSFEDPQQALWINVPEHGVLWQTPIKVLDRKSEGW